MSYERPTATSDFWPLEDSCRWAQSKGQTNVVLKTEHSAVTAQQPGRVISHLLANNTNKHGCGEFYSMFSTPLAFFLHSLPSYNVFTLILCPIIYSTNDRNIFFSKKREGSPLELEPARVRSPWTPVLAWGIICTNFSPCLGQSEARTGVTWVRGANERPGRVSAREHWLMSPRCHPRPGYLHI